MWGKYVVPKPEETISKKKNRHEVTDLIKKQTSSCGTESMAEGKGHWQGPLTVKCTLQASAKEWR